MSRLHIHHRTTYRYTAPVKFGMHRIVLRPREGHYTRVIAHTLSITPPANLTWLAAGVTLLRGFLAVGGQRAVGVGTCAEYAWTAETYTEGRSVTAPATPSSP